MNEAFKTLINDQIKNELESYYLYLSMAAYFHSVPLNGMAHWMRSQAHEETMHAMKFFDYVLERGETVVLQNIEQLKTGWSSPLQAFQYTFAHEQRVTATMGNLMKSARENGEFTAEPLITWFINEQVEEEASTSTIVNQLKMLGDSTDGLLMLDRELGTRPFPPGSPFDPLAIQAAGGG